MSDTNKLDYAAQRRCENGKRIAGNVLISYEHNVRTGSQDPIGEAATYWGVELALAEMLIKYTK